MEISGALGRGGWDRDSDAPALRGRVHLLGPGSGLGLVFSPLGWFLAAVSGAVFGGIGSWVLADFVTGEVPFGAWVRIIRSEMEARRRFRRDRLDQHAKAGDLR